MTQIYVNILRPKRFSSLLWRAGLVLLLVVLNSRQSFGQRVYADTEQNSGKQQLSIVGIGLITLSNVIDSTSSIDTNSFTDATELYALVQLGVLGNVLGVGNAWQNLQFNQINKPSPNSPVYFKANGSGGNVLGLLSGFSIQRTNSGASVGQNYNASYLLGLLGLLGTSNDSTYLFVPPDGNIQTFDGVKLQQAGLLAAGNSSYIYFSFFIATPKISADTDTICQYALTDSLTLTLGNGGETGITYYLFTDTAGLHYSPGRALNTAVAGYVGTFSNHQITIANPFLTMGTGDNKAQSYYIIAKDTANSPAFFYSAWKKITYKRTILEAPGQPTATIN
ncbi:MAG TPA: hypothetical protein VFL76_06445 [Edaphocola sp.]|nr:hypothetical protein [Edaphocola sp.]